MPTHRGEANDSADSVCTDSDWLKIDNALSRWQVPKQGKRVVRGASQCGVVEDAPALPDVSDGAQQATRKVFQHICRVAVVIHSWCAMQLQILQLSITRRYSGPQGQRRIRAGPGHAMGFQDTADIKVEPRSMTRFADHRALMHLSKPGEKRQHRVRVPGKPGRQLQQQAPQSLAQFIHAFEESFQEIAAIAQFGVMRDGSREFHGKAEIAGYDSRPSTISRWQMGAIER